MNTIAPYNFPDQVAWKTLDLLTERKAMLYPAGVAFYVWQRGERIVVAFDPSAIQIERVNDDFAHILSTRLHGRRVVRTNSRGLFFQIGIDIPAAEMPLTLQALDLSRQQTPWHMPIGLTAHGPLWISLMDADSVLIGGSRNGGKSGLTHGMLKALLHGGGTEVYATDGKRGAEYGRYISHPKFHFMANPKKELASLSLELARRLDVLAQSGYPNILMHNKSAREALTPIALFVDEIAELDDATKELLKGMVKLYRASGLYVILATNDPTQSSVLVKTNLSTRICFRVPSWNDSMTVLGMKGAEELPQAEMDKPGRGLIIWRGRLTEFQPYLMDWPTPTDETRKLLAEKFAEEKNPNPSGRAPMERGDETRILALHEQGKSNSAIVREIFGISGGDKFLRRLDDVKAVLAEKVTTTTTFMPVNAAGSALAGA
jgi:hypothetical protein